MCLGIGYTDFGWKIYHVICLGMGAYSLGIVLDFVFFSHLQIWGELRKCTQVYAWFMIGTSMCLQIGCADLGWKIFHNRCLGMGAYSLRMVLDFVFFHICIFDKSFENVHKCMCAHTHNNTYIMHAYTHMHPWTHINTCIHRHACTHIQWHAHTHTHSLTVSQK